MHCNYFQNYTEHYVLYLFLLHSGYGYDLEYVCIPCHFECCLKDEIFFKPKKLHGSQLKNRDNTFSRYYRKFLHKTQWRH